MYPMAHVSTLSYSIPYNWPLIGEDTYKLYSLFSNPFTSFDMLWDMYVTKLEINIVQTNWPPENDLLLKNSLLELLRRLSTNRQR